MMPTYRVTGADRETAADVDVEIHAANQEHAAFLANSRGVLVGSIHESAPDTEHQLLMQQLDAVTSELQAVRMAVEKVNRGVDERLGSAMSVKVLRNAPLGASAMATWVFTIAFGILMSGFLATVILSFIFSVAAGSAAAAIDEAAERAAERLDLETRE